MPSLGPRGTSKPKPPSTRSTRIRCGSAAVLASTSASSTGTYGPSSSSSSSPGGAPEELLPAGGGSEGRDAREGEGSAGAVSGAAGLGGLGVRDGESGGRLGTAGAVQMPSSSSLASVARPVAVGGEVRRGVCGALTAGEGAATGAAGGVAARGGGGGGGGGRRVAAGGSGAVGAAAGLTGARRSSREAGRDRPDRSSVLRRVGEGGASAAGDEVVRAEKAAASRREADMGLAGVVPVPAGVAGVLVAGVLTTTSASRAFSPVDADDMSRDTRDDLLEPPGVLKAAPPVPFANSEPIFRLCLSRKVPCSLGRPPGSTREDRDVAEGGGPLGGGGRFRPAADDEGTILRR